MVTDRARVDAAVVGAGPYGLSVSAHLRARGQSVATFGKPLELWRDHMPEGMLLRSHWWATHLSDPERRYSFDRFFQQTHTHAPAYPLPIEAFVDYGRWFQEHAVPELDETYVRTIAKSDDDRFRVTLVDGRAVDARTVVIALGVAYFTHRPSEYAALPASLVSHACDHRDLKRFAGARVIVVGAGQSAIESAALLHEVGANVAVVTRKPINWLAVDRTDNRPWLDKLRAPKNGLAPGWVNWILEKQPYLFHKLPQPRKDRHNALWGAAAAAWLHDRIVGKIDLHESRSVVDVSAHGRGVVATLSDGSELHADHLFLATGYQMDLDRLPMLDPMLRAGIATYRGAPTLNSHFESSVPGLYFVGFASTRSFGPLYRFVAGCPAAASRVAGNFSARN